MNKPFISIIMPVYNAEKYVAQAIDSVLKQTYKNWELWIIDDGSKDGSERIIQNKKCTDDRIRFVKNEQNMGVAKTRNRGVQLANGEWIAFLDSDDMWEEEKLEKQAVLLEKGKNVGIVYTGSAFVDENNKRAEYILNVPQMVSFQKLLKQNVISCSSVLVQKYYMQKYKMPDGDLHEDYATWLRILKEGGMAYGIDEPLLIYRVSSQSKSGNKVHAVKMQYRVYRLIGLNLVKRMYYMGWYAMLNLKKYKHIYKTFVNTKRQKR